jgi:hypothetical protein
VLDIGLNFLNLPKTLMGNAYCNLFISYVVQLQI